MANKYVVDPRQTLALSHYTNPKSETFADLKNSMIKAGYDEAYANSISGRNPEWLSENTKKDVRMVQRAEKNLQRYIDLDIKLNTKNDIDLAKLQFEVSKFVLKTIGKKKYSEDGESETPNVQINIVNYGDKKTPNTSDHVQETTAKPSA